MAVMEQGIRGSVKYGAELRNDNDCTKVLGLRRRRRLSLARCGAVGNTPVCNT